MDEEISFEWSTYLKFEGKSFFFCIRRNLLDSQMFSCRHKKFMVVFAISCITNQWVSRLKVKLVCTLIMLARVIRSEVSNGHGPQNLLRCDRP